MPSSVTTWTTFKLNLGPTTFNPVYMIKKLAFIGISALLLTACATEEPASTGDDPMAQITAKVNAYSDPSLWTVPYTLDGAEGLSFKLPEALTYSGGGDTDSSSASWVTEKESGDEYFTVTSYTLIKCENAQDCGLDTVVPATPAEVVENLIQNPPDGCSAMGEIAVGNMKGQAFDCQSPAIDRVYFYGSKGAYSVSNSLEVLLGNEAISTTLFQNFLATFQVE